MFLFPFFSVLKFTSGFEVFYEVKFYMQITYNVNLVCVRVCVWMWAYVWWAAAFAVCKCVSV